jgi:hypothetical protein
LARVNGLTGKSTRKSYWRSAETMGPLLSSRHTATGCPLNRVRRVWTHTSIASGLCSRIPNSRLSVPAAWTQTSCLASAQSRPTNAANSSCDTCFMFHLPECARVVQRDMPACVLRRHYREPVTRQTLSIR